MPRNQAPSTSQFLENKDLLEQDLEKFFSEGKKVRKVKPGETGQDEKNRSKHIVISRKQQPPRRR